MFKTCSLLTRVPSSPSYQNPLPHHHRHHHDHNTTAVFFCRVPPLPPFILNIHIECTVVVEHFIILLKLVIDAAIPDVPEWVERRRVARLTEKLRASHQRWTSNRKMGRGGGRRGSGDVQSETRAETSPFLGGRRLGGNRGGPDRLSKKAQ